MARWRRSQPVESPNDRLVFARDAGLGRLSLMGVLSGTLVAYGAFTVLAAIAGGLIAALGFETESLSANDWRQLGIGGGVVVGLVLLCSYLVGGYTAGRMARRAGATNGLGVFTLGIVIALVVGAVVSLQADTNTIVSNLRSMGVPTSASEYAAIGTFAGLGAVVAMAMGAVVGGTLGERWHGKIAQRAAVALAVREGPAVQPGDYPDDLTERVYEPTVDAGDQPEETVDLREPDPSEQHQPNLRQ